MNRSIIGVKSAIAAAALAALTGAALAQSATPGSSVPRDPGSMSPSTSTLPGGQVSKAI